MPRKRLPMRTISEVLQLKAAGTSMRDIAASTGASTTTVYENLTRAQGAGLNWPLPEGLDDEALQAKLFPPRSAQLDARGRGPTGERCTETICACGASRGMK
jgi:hypothetical protein